MVTIPVVCCSDEKEMLLKKLWSKDMYVTFHFGWFGGVEMDFPQYSTIHYQQGLKALLYGKPKKSPWNLKA